MLRLRTVRTTKNCSSRFSHSAAPRGVVFAGIEEGAWFLIMSYTTAIRNVCVNLFWTANSPEGAGGGSSGLEWQ